MYSVRTFRWDKVEKFGLKMTLYERYIDDSNQEAESPPPGSIYDAEKNEIAVDLNLAIDDEDQEAKLTRVLKGVANSVIPEI